MTLQQRVEELTMTYGNSSKKVIGEFILRKKGCPNEYTIQEIADETYTSKAALVRFAKSLGYGGWKEFVKEFAAEQHYQESHYSDIDPNFPFVEGDSTRDIIQKMSSLQVESILDTADLLDPRMIEKMAELLMKSNRVAVFGMNPNLLLGELFHRRRMTIKKRLCHSHFLLRKYRKSGTYQPDSHSGSRPGPHYRHHKLRQQQASPPCGLYLLHLLPGTPVQQNLHLCHRKIHPVYSGYPLFRLLFPLL